MIIWQEASVAYPEWTEEAFNGFDRNSDGQLDKEEYETAVM